MTEEIFRADAYEKQCEARVTVVDAAGIHLDRTVFYPMGGGQPGDTGILQLQDGSEIRINDTRKDAASGDIVHVPEGDIGADLVGQQVQACIDWDRRHRIMRIHTLMHLLCAVIPAGVTGGSIRDGSGRLDFDLPESTLDKEHISAELNRLVEENHRVSARWISDEELAANPELVRTMSVKPPTGSGQVRVLEVEDVDLQPCGGTHVAATGEIGRVRVRKIEKKGKHNRRVNVEFAE
ncbi:MAG: alanyl-tRNA editing protein [Gammaproteobacteria bacterium]|jgi:misacylated tRNA(Ala) deacylase|nr:alanyl-tRNA editing protein [Gammaproteobacteria bacterium]